MVSLLDDACLREADPPDQTTVTIAHTVRTGQRGRPRTVIDNDFLAEGLRLRGNVGVARVTGRCPRTVRRCALRQGLATPGPPVFVPVVQDGQQVAIQRNTPRRDRGPTITDEHLDHVISQLLERFPNFGRAMLDGAIDAIGFQVARERIVSSYLRVHGAPRIFGDRRIERREYRVAGANSLWHNDGQHGW